MFNDKKIKNTKINLISREKRSANVNLVTSYIAINTQ